MKWALATILVLQSLFIWAHKSNDIADSPELVTPIHVGEIVPDEYLYDASGNPVSLRNLAAKKRTVLVVYRGGWCPYCNTQLRELQGIENELRDLGYQLIAISPESPDKIDEMTKERSLSYTLYSDYFLKVAKGLGIAFHMDDKTAKMYKDKLNADLKSYEDERLKAVPIPAVFVLDTKGQVRFSYTNPNYRVRLHPELLLTAAKVALKDEEVRHKRKRK